MAAAAAEDAPNDVAGSPEDKNTLLEWEALQVNRRISLFFDIYRV